MPEHYTKNVVEASVWCKVCGKFTMHRIDGGRRGPCLNCMNALPPAIKKDPPKQDRLF